MEFYTYPWSTNLPIYYYEPTPSPQYLEETEDAFLPFLLHGILPTHAAAPRRTWEAPAMKQTRRQPSFAVLRVPEEKEDHQHQHRHQQQQHHHNPFSASSYASQSRPQPKSTIAPRKQQPQLKHTPTTAKKNTRTISAPKTQKQIAVSSAPVNQETMMAKKPFSPRFDMYETDSAYYLSGSLPGVRDKKAINIDFSSGDEGDSVTISGCIKRDVEKKVEEKKIEEEKEQEQGETTDNDDAQSVTSEKSLQPYVEDTDDECDPITPSSKESLRSRRSSTCSTRSMDSSRSRPAAGEMVRYSPPEKKEEKRKLDVNHYPRTIVSERSFGEFSRKFKFPSPVSVEDVKATLEDGLLEISVPKKRFLRRRIEI
ncbi:hypothetical protein BZA77DRAFT_302835, partial [Pyronema omphalodes]